ncbi:MAG: holo-ACP synthase [Rickettsiales bacterium]|nr:holo-ACP synthase [Rickettsiales bacterium]
MHKTIVHKEVIMILGCGIDMVESNRFIDWSMFKKQRIFTKKELEFADSDSANSEKHLANFWAAREAFVKALGCGFDDSLSFSDVSVMHEENGRPELLISGGAKTKLKELTNGEKTRVHISLTDQGEYSAAMVIIEVL